MFGLAQNAIAQNKSVADPAKRQVFFGELHMITRKSSDAFRADVAQT